MSEPTVLDQVKTSINTVEKQNETLIKSLDQLTTDTKKAMEEITLLKNSGADFAAQLRAIQKFNTHLGHERRMAFGDPMKRLLSDDEKVSRMFLEFAKFLDYGKQAEKKVGAEFIKKALGEDTSPGSTYLTPEMARDIYDLFLTHGKWSTLGVESMGTQVQKMPVDTAEPVCNVILTEGGTIADDTNKTGTSVNLDAEVYAVLLKVSLQLLEDSQFDVAARVMRQFMNAFNYRLDYVSFCGDGTADATNGGVTGILNFGTSVVADSTRTTIGATKYTDWLKCLTGVNASVLERQPRWWMHPTLAAAAIGVQDSNGRPIFQTALESPGGGVFNLFGFPVTFVGALPTTNAASAKVAIFGDGNAMAVGVRRDFMFEASDHFSWNTFQRTFRGVARADAVGKAATGLTVLSTAAS